jgi:RNA polymerase sigma-54 factor
MSLRPGTRQSQTQRIGLTPAMRASLAYLKMSASELQDEIARQAAENPFLVSDRSGDDWGVDAVLNIAAPEPGLTERLRAQIRLQRLDPDVADAAMLLVGELRDDGYLDSGLDSLADEFGIPHDRLSIALRAVQHCEPVGVGARDLAECLRLQFEDAGIAGPLAARAVEHLDVLRTSGIAP